MRFYPRLVALCAVAALLIAAALWAATRPRVVEIDRAETVNVYQGGASR